ncbi:conserved protein of unknown function, might belong to Motility accessory factor Maf [Shewanella benthica]|uniref:6-hydroxymethylpterin diphosphokinase MptE-like domain-containing protein n=1 Tax=Shewanella benthica TaxID=43661 RepID=A0A330MCQ4_9GAMM|nr:6-hydroxymethylpterin diphosphokinase MptE-like protein [Shewanella benthica]SQH77577.1 conserved protein of unknown function, might belong to Motility accessory factor Maf [Shewanella benthica]
MTELFSTNLQIIQQRWPALALALNSQNIENLDAKLVTATNQTISVNGIQLSSRYNRLAEAQLLINQISTDERKVTVYGLGMGDVPSLLIDSKTVKQIDICILNLQVLALLLSYTDQTEWLDDSRVTIIHSPSQDRFDDNAISVLPDLLLASDENSRLRDLLVLENNREYANKKHQSDDPKIIKRFKENQRLLEQDPDAASLSLIHTQNNALIVGAGPSLELHYEYLRSQRALPIGLRPLMIAVDTALMGLISEEIIPDIVVSIDSEIKKKHFPDVIPPSIKLVYFPRVAYKVLIDWPGERFNAYSKNSLYDELDSHTPKLRLFSNGSVIHPAIDLAVYLNTKELTLFGCDFSYPNDKTHAFWEDGALGADASHAKHWVLNGHGKRVPTELNFRAYLRSLEHYIHTHPQVKFYQSSLEGALIHGAQYRECKI